MTLLSTMGGLCPFGLVRLEEAYAKGGLGSWLKSLEDARIDVMRPRYRTS